LHHNSVAAAEGGAKQKLICYDCGVACDLDQMKEERLYFLRRMNAWTPPAAVAAPTRALDGVVGPDRKKRHPVTRMQQDENDRRRYRLRYTKTDRIAYLGHLDLIRHLPRIFRRAGLDMFYSSGFHPKPELSFGPALGLGIRSLSEIIDVHLAEEVEPAELVRRLNAVTLDGIRFLAATALRTDDRALGRLLGRARYLALMPDAAAVATAQVTFAEGAPLFVVREGDRGIGRRLDVRRTLLDVGPGDEDLARQVGWPAEHTLAFALAVDAEASARPAEVVKALGGPEDAELVRVGLDAALGDGEQGLRYLDPLDATALRNAPPRPRPATAPPAPAPAASA
jgi:radical SAM-linked protein